jgi:hypothetical protein
VDWWMPFDTSGSKQKFVFVFFSLSVEINSLRSSA